jgi:thioredoxin-disulfide reductase
MKDLIIIGGGPAGMTAGIYAARQKLNTLLITKEFGGQMTKKAVPIENWPGEKEISGFDLIQKFKSHLEKFGVDIEKDGVVKIEKKNEVFNVSTEKGKNFEAKTVIIASGNDPRPLKVPGEKEFIGKGVSYCPTCDAPVFKDKFVAVIGGGNSGFETAIMVSKWAKKLYILEFGTEVKAEAENQEMAKKTGKVEVITNAAMKEIKGEKFVNAIIYQDLKTKEEKKLEVGGVFVEIGLQPCSSFARELVECNERGEIGVNFETFETKTPGLFAAGDVKTGKYKQIVIASGEGAKAALFANDYLKKYQK